MPLSNASHAKDRVSLLIPPSFLIKPRTNTDPGALDKQPNSLDYRQSLKKPAQPTANTSTMSLFSSLTLLARTDTPTRNLKQK